MDRHKHNRISGDSHSALQQSSQTDHYDFYNICGPDIEDEVGEIQELTMDMRPESDEDGNNYQHNRPLPARKFESDIPLRTLGNESRPMSKMERVSIEDPGSGDASTDARHSSPRSGDAAHRPKPKYERFSLGPSPQDALRGQVDEARQEPRVVVKRFNKGAIAIVGETSLTGDKSPYASSEKHPSAGSSGGRKKRWEGVEESEDRIEKIESVARKDPSSSTRFRSRVENAIRNTCSVRRRKVLVTAGVIITVLGLLLFVGLFPPSFVRVDYYEIALKRHKTSGRVETDYPYYPGEYILGPDVEFLKYNGTAHFVYIDKIGISTPELVEVPVSFSFQYFLRQPDLGQMYLLYGVPENYQDIIQKVAVSTVKITIPQFTLDEIRLKRKEVENTVYSALRDKLQGDCCLPCCDTSCKMTEQCQGCRTALEGCNPGYYITVPTFQLRDITIPDEISERLLRRLLLKEEAETEIVQQKLTMVNKETERKVMEVTHKEDVVRQKGEAEATSIVNIARAKAEKITHNATIEVWDMLCQALNMTREDHKLSFLFSRELEGLGKLNMLAGGDERSHIAGL